MWCAIALLCKQSNSPWRFMNIHIFGYLGKMLAYTKWKNYGGGLAEMDIMNQSELIYDNSCLLSFVCLTYKPYNRVGN